MSDHDHIEELKNDLLQLKSDLTDKLIEIDPLLGEKYKYELRHFNQGLTVSIKNLNLVLDKHFPDTSHIGDHVGT